MKPLALPAGGFVMPGRIYGMSKEVETRDEPGKLVSSPALNKKLLRNARKSIGEIAEETGLPAEEVAERMSNLLAERNWRDDLMEERLLLIEMGQLIEDIRERMREASTDEDYGSMARAQLSAIKLTMDQITKRRKALDGELASVTMAQARLMGEAIKIAMERAVLTLEQQFPEINGEAVRVAFEDALPGAMAVVDARTE